MHKKIVIIGSCNTDMVISSEHLPVPGETVLGGSFLMNAGGKGANQAVAAARLGGNVYFVAKTGNDLFGRQSIEQYKKEGIHVDYIQTDPELPSGIALIMVDNKGENIISVASGANAALRPNDLSQINELREEGNLLLMQLETPLETIEYAARLAKEQGNKVFLNPAPARPLPDSLLRNLYMIIPNETEAELISGVQVTDTESARKAAEIISSQGVSIVVITMGKKGVFVKEGEQCYTVPAHEVKAVDTTAAGDTFCGALCVGISEGMCISDAVQFANRCAAISVTRKGAQASVPYREELNCQS